MSVLVYLGIAQFVAGGLALSDWSMGFGQDGLRIGWMAVSTGVLALGFWLVGLLTRRRGVSDFYVAPCFHWCLGLTLVVLSLSISSRYLAREAYRFGVLALALNACATILLSVTWRRTELTYPAVLHLVIATYLVLFSVGNNDPRMAFVLGLAAVIQAIVWWAVGFACERVAGGRARSYAPPLYHLAVGLTMLGIVLSDRSAVVLAMAAVAFLLTVKSLPRVEWLYAAVACAAPRFTSDGWPAWHPSDFWRRSWPGPSGSGRSASWCSDPGSGCAIGWGYGRWLMSSRSSTHRWRSA